MSIEGVDYAWARPDPAKLYGLGKRFACRYISNSTTIQNGVSKNLDAGERDRLHAAGLGIVVNWEWKAGDAQGGYAAGVANAKSALTKANALGLPSSRPIYFSVDYDPAGAYAAIDSYFDGIASILPRTRIGVYGGYRTVAHLAANGKATWFWQAYAWSTWADSDGVRRLHWFSGAHIQQYNNGAGVLGVDDDLDRALVADYGQWTKAPTVEVPDVSAQDVADAFEAGGLRAANDIGRSMDTGFDGMVGRLFRNNSSVKALVASVDATAAGVVALRSVVEQLAAVISAGGGSVDTQAILAGVDVRLAAVRADFRDAVADLGEGGAAKVRAEQP